MKNPKWKKKIKCSEVFIKNCLELFSKDPKAWTRIIHPPDPDHKEHMENSVLIFNPMLSHSLKLVCPHCRDNSLQFKGKYTDGSSYGQPRRLYGLDRNALLVSGIYTCPGPCSRVLAHDEDLIAELPKEIELGFILTTNAGFTWDLCVHILELTRAGNYNFHYTHLDTL